MPNLSWKSSALKDLVERKHGTSQAIELEKYLGSLTKKIKISAYHSFESRKLLDKFFEDKEGIDNYTYAFDLILGPNLANISDEEKAKAVEFYDNSWKAEAHVVAFAHAMHSLADIMAQVINTALHLEVKINKVNLTSITEKAIDYEVLHSMLTELSEMNEYKYISAFVNSHKHICFVPATFTVMAEMSEGDRFHGLKIPGFSYKGCYYREKWSHDFVYSDFQKMECQILTIGIELNNILGK